MEKPNSVPWPPLLGLACLVIAILLHMSMPLGWPPSPFSDFLFGFAVLFLATAFFLYFASFQALKRHNTTVSPVSAASKLVTSGPFAISRNPIYLANVILFFGLAGIFENAWLGIMAFVMAPLLHRLAILPEEKHLELKFGKQWRAYRKQVRRWF